MQDIRFALRTLAKAPLVTGLCVMCLAIGIGLNSNIYSFVYAVFQRPFPYADPDRLVQITERNTKRGWNDSPIAFETFRDVERQATLLAPIAAASFYSVTLTDGEDPVQMRAALVSSNLFSLLGVRPHLGRTFRQDEDVAGAADALILGYGVWVSRYHADSSIIGRSIPANGVPHTIVGVMPNGFMFPEREQAWVPITPTLQRRSRLIKEIRAFARLKPNVDVGAATSQLTTISARLALAFPNAQGDWTAYAEPIRTALVPREIRLVLAAMMGAVTFVLLIACANVANLLLARATTRSREIAIRVALGAGRGRIVRQLLTESVLLALIACPIGIGIAFWLLDVIVASFPEGEVPYYFVFRIDGPVLLYTVAITVVTGLVFGLAPALQATGRDLQSALKEGGRGSGVGFGRHRLRTALAVGEVALALVLLIGAALFVRSFANLQQNHGGIETANLLTLRFFMANERGGDAINARVTDVVQRIEAIPGVVSATASNLIPLAGGGVNGPIEIEGKPPVNRADAPVVSWSGVTAHWFATLGIPLLEGRTFSDQVGPDSSAVAVINETMARQFWPSESAVGRRFRQLGDTASAWFTVIGVSQDFRRGSMDSPGPIGPAYMVSYRYLIARNTGVMIRTRGDPAQMTTAVRSAIRAASPAMPVFSALSMEEVRRLGIWNQRLFGWLFAMFGIVALVLASVGVYGVIAYGASQRTHEIGVRVALGAQPSDVIRLIVGGGARLAGSGIALGLVGSLALTRVIQSLLFDVSSFDVPTFVGVSLLLAAVALIASYIPARRATRVDPLTALRSE